MGSPKEKSISEIKPKINGIFINGVFNTKILGIHIDNRLSFDHHIQRLTKDLNSKLALIYRLKQFLSEDTLNFVYKSIVRPKLEYGCAVFDFTYDIHLDLLTRIQKRFARLITNSSFLSHSAPLFERLGWKTLKSTISYESLIYIFKSINGFGSESSKDIFEVNNNRTSRRRCGRDRLHINPPMARKNFLSNTIFCKGIELWNSISLDIRSSDNIKQFKAKLNSLNFNTL